MGLCLDSVFDVCLPGQLSIHYFFVLFVYFELFIQLSLLLQKTLDALDGKQARRTHSASPLGQLFDHGM